MKKALFISVLVSIGIIICSCSNRNTNTANTSNTNTTVNTTNNSPATGNYNASGTISFTADGVNFSCSIDKVIIAPTTLTIQTSTTDVRNTGSVVVTCYTATSAVTTGTYSAASSATIASVAFIDKTFTPFAATAATNGSSCTVNITVLTSTSIKGTFTATVVKPLDKSTVSITNGVIDCTITSK
jgi:hypothetical protein